MKFDIDFQSLEDFIYTRKSSPKTQISFPKLSKLAHTSHSSIKRRYRKFLSFKRDDSIDINKSRAKRCCNMVKSHLEDLKEVQSYLHQHELYREHPVFYNKITKWINECDGIYSRYKKQIKEL